MISAIKALSVDQFTIRFARPIRTNLDQGNDKKIFVLKSSRPKFSRRRQILHIISATLSIKKLAETYLQYWDLVFLKV